ncbi:MAG TPA: bifunctional hydroxymethylpyrimidine kinase/phosphomethylpyrimidine kinase [Chloroflexi bacterium]|nr:bifunctional hydroxymethylpyrimidine kinase/phosphomethylpyrimidine kinase [Chloroflexota bacterium]
MYRALTIAGSDSGGGAGIQADLKTFAALGVYGMSVLTSITAQNTVGVQGIYDLPPEFVGLQIDSVLTDIGADAVKTGMLSNTKIITLVAEKLRRYQVENLVIDPVMIAKSGDPLLREEAHVTLVHDLFPLAKVVTPNLHEARVLSRLPTSNLEEMKEAAKAIHRLGPQNVVVKGGHLEGESVDLLYDGHQFLEFPGPRLETKNDHGTGCTFASAIAAGLAKGQDVPTAVKAAKEYITQALQGAIDWRLGGGHGPVHHFFALW